MGIHKATSAAILLVLVGAAACTSGGDQASEPAATPAAKAPEPKIAAVEEEQTFEEYSYDPGGKRDPFRPPQEMFENRVAETAMAEAPVGPPATPLEELDVVEWKLTAVIQTPGAPKAMVEDSTGRGYIIELGTTIGRWKGKVARIEEDRVIVVETYRDQRGGERRQEIPLLLRNPEEKEQKQS